MPAPAWLLLSALFVKSPQQTLPKKKILARKKKVHYKFFFYDHIRVKAYTIRHINCSNPPILTLTLPFLKRIKTPLSISQSSFFGTTFLNGGGGGVIGKPPSLRGLGDVGYAPCDSTTDEPKLDTTSLLLGSGVKLRDDRGE